MTVVKHPAFKWVLLAGVLLALAVLLLSSRAAAAECGGPLKLGEQTSDWIQRAGTTCTYEFKGTAGQEIALAMIGVTLDNPYLELYAPGSRSPLTEKACAKKPVDRASRLRPPPTPTPRPPRILPESTAARVTCVLPDDGIYRIVAGSDPLARTKAAAGQFVLNLCGTHIASPYAETLKEFRTGAITRGGLACYSFEAEAGDCVTTAMNKDLKTATRSDTLDPWLDLRDPTGAIIASDDESNGDGDALIRNLCLKKPGLYTIIARSYDATGVGPFTFYFALQEGARMRMK